MIKEFVVGVPKNIISRDSYNKEALAQFERVTGIKKTRRFEGDTIDMIFTAIDKANINTSNIDALIVLTQSPTRLSPCLAIEVHDYLDLDSSVPCFDINQSCCGWIYALWLASRIYYRTLVICADQLRFHQNEFEDLIFSDSVSLTLVGNCPMWVDFYNDGSKSQVIYCGLNGKMGMNGSVVSDWVTTKLPELIKPHCEMYSFLIPHQANLSMNKILERRSGFRDRCLYSIEEFGNMSFNSIPATIAYNEKKILGKSIMLAGFGAGFSAAFTGLDWNPIPISRIVEI